MTVDEFLAQLKAADLTGRYAGDWTEWKALQDTYSTHEMKMSMSREQRLELHRLTHVSTNLADPDGTWSDRLSERLEREFRASLAREATSGATPRG